ncbi:hypothetical protein G3A_09980 [Bacillus sp. 17376]|uniref:GmrSD restriction endonucleases N-terminal domain-containing protein n=1 Tax=Mesobacillus boroniphilus JCM 21738 TaxID=1294265 RepID=W4RRD1_9BACI|nr:DUF262 domain-containing protein [Mesobacillus boroniphilus]ESU32722.1 hypothetical protein G3A_09980 [Bacillus sp. 17376]GAE46985.1 hypothetical protein JCM21738_3921 [Mesobacillus boroniphilus JCM 21738]
MVQEENDWLYKEEDAETADEYVFNEYDITSSPNDFNILTIYNFLESGVVKIPSFQRNFVWDIVRASKLIESLIIGLPIPQIFLYEEARNKFLVIDGQQRLMSIYYFMKQRFPRKDKRTKLGNIFDKEGKIPDEILESSEYFRPFKLKLADKPGRPNKLKNLTYETLGEYKTNFDLRTVRNIIIKQNHPEEDNSSIYEIFYRLNSGGLNLRPQEIRSSLHHSKFDDMLKRINIDEKWRRLLGQPNPDLRLKDIEILLRGFAMLYEGESYRAPMVNFLNKFANTSQKFDDKEIEYLEKLFYSFLNSCEQLEPTAFYTKTGKFNISTFEAVFTATCQPYLKEKSLVDHYIQQKNIQELRENPEFVEATHSATASSDNVKLRLKIAQETLEVQ